VFFLGNNYAPTALASLRLIALRPERPLRLPGLLGDVRDCSLRGVYLATQAGVREVVVGIVVVALGFVQHGLRGGNWHEPAADAELSGRRAPFIIEHANHWLRRSARRVATP
jgi:hypothetical protein